MDRSLSEFTLDELLAEIKIRVLPPTASSEPIMVDGCTCPMGREMYCESTGCPRQLFFFGKVTTVGDENFAGRPWNQHPS